MKNVLRFIAMAALCLLLAAPAMAAQEGYYTYEYSEEWGGAEITGYTGSETNIVVPSKLGGYDVVSFSPWMSNDFDGSDRTLTLPQTIRYMNGLPASLNALYLPGNVEAVGSDISCMGNYKTYLDKDSATAKLLAIGQGEYPSICFIDPDEPQYQIYYIRNEAGEIEVGLRGYWGTEEIVTIPEGIHHIYNYAFTPGNYYIPNTTAKKIYLPDSLKTIGDGAFSCDNLEEIWLPSNLVECGSSILPNTDVIVHCDIDSQTMQVLTSDSIIQGVTDPDEPDWGFLGDGKGNLVAARYNGNDEHIVVPDGVVRLGDYAINNQNVLTLTLPSSVTSIGNYAVINCVNMTDIYLPDGITEWGTSPIYCYANTIIHCSLDSDTVRTMPYIEYSLAGIYDAENPEWMWKPSSDGTLVVSKYLGSASEVTLPDGLTEIPDQMFFENGTITTLVIPDSVTKLGNSSFYNMTALKEVYLPDHITDWGNGNFFATDSAYTEDTKIFLNIDSVSFRSMPNHPYGTWFPGVYDANYPNYLWDSDGKGGMVICKYLGSAAQVVIPDGVTGIADKAFYDMPQLTSVTVPDSVTTIGDSAFGINYDNYNANPEKYKNLIIYLPDNITEISYRNFMPDTKRFAVCTYGSKTADAIDHLNELDEHLYNFYIDPRWPGCLIGKLDGTVYFAGYIGSDTVLTTPPVCTVISSHAVNNTPNRNYIEVVNISEGTTRIEEGSCLFFNIKTLNLPSTLRTIEKNAFSGVTTLIIPEGVTSLPENTFTGALENLVLPKSVTSIHKNAFTKNYYENNHLYYTVENIFCYEGSYADGWANNRPYQNVEYIEEGEYHIYAPASLSNEISSFFAEMGEDFDWASRVTIAPTPTIDYTLKVTSSDKDIVEVKNGKLILKQPGTVKLKISSPELGASVSKKFTVYAALEEFSLPEYMFRKVGTSRITIKPSGVTPSEGTYQHYYWTRTPITPGFYWVSYNGKAYETNRLEDPSVHYLTVTARNGMTSGGYLVFYDIVHDVKFSAFSGDYNVGDIVQPQISVSLDGTAYKNNRYTYTLTSSDPTVAKVTSKGKLQLLSKGTATITCEALDGTTIKRKITVQDINVYTIPKALQVISSEAFAGCPAQKIVIQDGCQSIGEKAFADCAQLETIEIPASVTSIADDAFDGCPEGMVIDAPAGSYAAQYAEANGYTK